jgi:diguanylate cyclase (GGDEF)-like protein/PAS domain S-box-containing protein
MVKSIKHNFLLSKSWLSVWLFTAVSYCILGKICLALGAIGGTASPLWLPAGLVTTLSLRYGLRALPGIFFGQFLFATFFEPGTVGAHVLLGIGNLLEGWMVCLLAPKLMRNPDPFDSLHNFLSFFAASMVGSGLNALVGTGTLLLSHLIQESDFSYVMLHWSVGDLGGALIIAPLVCAWWHPFPLHWRKLGLSESILLLVVVASISYAAFGGLLTLQSAPMAFFLLPFLLWASLRLDLKICTLLNTVMMTIIIAETTHGHGPFANHPATESLVLIQTFTSVIIITSLIAFIISNDRRRIMENLRGEAKRFESKVAERTEELTQQLDKRQEAEQAFRNANQRLHLLLDSMAEGAYGVDIHGYCTFVNRSFLRILGYSHAEEIIGKHIHELIHHAYPDGSPYPSHECRMYAAFMHNQEFHVSDEVFWRKDGVPVPVEYWSQPLVSDGITAGAIATFIDITDRKKTENALIESEHRLRSIIETEPECIKVIDASGRLIEMNAAGLAMLEARSLAEAQSRNLIAYVAEEDREAFVDLHHRVMQGHSGILEFKIKGLKGTERTLETHATPMRDAQNNVTCLLAITRDISQRKEAEQQLRIAAATFESQEGILVTDVENKILRVNQAFTSITGYSEEEVVGKNPNMLSSGRHNKQFFADMWSKIQNTNAWKGEIWNRRKNGEVFPELLTITAVRNTQGIITNYVASITDITVSKAAAERIERLAFYDSLTDLPNRRLLMDRLKHALASSARSGRQGALLFLDLDHFKTLNDTLGHDTGDILLQQVATRLSTCVREDDTVARLGGDEFVVMLEDLNELALNAAAQIENIGEKILSALNRPYLLGRHSYHTTASIGVTLFSGHNLEIEELLKQADIAMYQAKKAGRNTLRFFNPEMQASINIRAALEVELRKALENQEFKLYYQIQMHSSGRILGSEALIRWIHPERGVIPPSYFIPIAEESGFILPIGQWVLEHACAQLASWQEIPALQNIPLSVNVSAKQFHQAHFAAQVNDTIRAFGINPNLLRLELTESLVLHDIEETIATMNTLKQVGVQFSLDDFGTGYSSLQYLKRLPIYQIKIDRSFVRDIVVDSNDEAIVRTIIAMAQSLDLDFIAEGVETEEQKQVLLHIGCTHYQGYLFSPPIPIQEFESKIAELSTA